jgi:hypothetical protein
MFPSQGLLFGIILPRCVSRSGKVKRDAPPVAVTLFTMTATCALGLTPRK